VGRSTRLGYQKEAVCIVSWEGVYVGRSTRLGYEKEAVSIVSGRYRDGRFVTCSCAMIFVCAACRRRSRGCPGEAPGGGGVCEGINAGWVAQNKRWQMGVIGRGKGCRDNLSCVRPWCSLRCEEISHRVWNVGARCMFGGRECLCRQP